MAKMIIEVGYLIALTLMSTPVLLMLALALANGVLYPKHFLGLLFIKSVALNASFSLTLSKAIRLGKNCRFFNFYFWIRGYSKSNVQKKVNKY
jgi:hypothetical protein